MSEIKLNFYIIQNKEGKYFRAKGFGGYGNTWVEDVKNARVYQKIGQARSRVSFFANTYPEYGVPDILELTVTGVTVLDETSRVEKAAKAKAKKELKRVERAIEHQRVNLAHEQAILDERKRRLGL